MNTYHTFYKGLFEEVEAETSYKAQQKALDLFQARGRRNVKGHDISVVLCAQAGRAVIHSTSEI